MALQDRPEPIKRHPRLQPISRANHQGLMFCLLLEKGLRRGIELNRLRSFSEYFWETFWELHRMQLQETIEDLLNSSDPFLKDYRVGYEKLTEIWCKGRPLAKAEILSNLKDELRSFIRWQERSLFKHIQDCYTQQLAVCSFPEPAHEVCARWSDPFWG